MSYPRVERGPDIYDMMISQSARQRTPAAGRWHVLPLLPTVVVLLAVTDGCSINKLVINKLSDAVASGGTVYSSDNDPELIRDAVPFSLKLMETLLEQNPDHVGLLTAAAGGFTQYAYAFITQEADRAALVDVERYDRYRTRARRMYLRAREYALHGLNVAHKGLPEALMIEPRTALEPAGEADVPLLYWAAASWAGAISVSKDQPALIADLPQVEALIDRAYALDPDWDHGALHSFLITFEMARTFGTGSPESRARDHFEKAAALSDGQMAGPFVALAEAVCVPEQNVREFRQLLTGALAVDPDARPEWRLVNLIMQERARWLLSRAGELFLVPDPPTDWNDGS